MEFIIWMFALLLGGVLGFVVFYFRYADKWIVDDLRSKLSKYESDSLTLTHDHKEFTQQNLLLKQQVTELLGKNDDLGRIVSELYRYYDHIQDGYQKALELANILKVADKTIDTKIKQLQTTTTSVAPTIQIPIASHHSDSHKKIF